MRRDTVEDSPYRRSPVTVFLREALFRGSTGGEIPLAVGQQALHPRQPEAQRLIFILHCGQFGSQIPRRID